MVYKNDFVAIISVNGKILREQNGSVELPFGSDYSIRLKNLESRKARIKVSIDGEDVLSGNSLLLAPNTDMTLEGFLDGDTVRKKFRFIQKTQEIVDHRGDRMDDGIVRIEYCFEQRKPEYAPMYNPRWSYSYPKHPPFPTITWGSGITADDSYKPDISAGGPPKEFIADCSYSGGEQNTSGMLRSIPQVDEGITVRGAEASQHFSNGHIGLTDAPHVITIKLRGVKGSGAVVEQPVGTKDKVTCPACSRRWNARQHFCGNCGANLGH